MSESNPQLPLSGITVLDLSAVIMGPFCTQTLAELGAEVIKVEAPEGDIIRNVGPASQPGMAAMFLNVNRGKRSIALDLNDPQARAALDGLIRRADVFIHSMLPNGISRMKLDYAAVSAIKPDIIYCSLNGFGRSGPYAGQPAYDDIIQAACGMAALEGEIRGTPGYAATVIGDKVSALTATYSIIAALLHHRNTGMGQEIEVPMFETLAAFTLVEHLSGAIHEQPISRPLYARVVSPYRHPYRTTTSHIAALVHTDRMFERFCDLIGKPEVKADPRFHNIIARSHNINAYYQFLEAEFATRPAEEWIPLLKRAGCPVQQILSTDDLLHDPHLEAVDFFKRVKQGDATLVVPGHPVKYSATPARTCEGVPQLGEHTIALLREAGLTEAEIQSLIDRRAAIASAA